MKHIRKLGSILIALCILTSMSITAFAATFDDVSEEHWSFAAVEDAVQRGLVNGYGNGKFGPNDSVTNVEWSQMIVNLAITDVPSAIHTLPWWYPAVRAIHYEKIWNGTVFMEAGLDYSKPNPYNTIIATQPVNRYDMAQMIYNMSLSKNINFDLSVDTTNISIAIADYMDIPVKYRTAVEYCYAAGLIVGTDTQGTFNGDANMTRGAAATILVRLSDVLNNEWEIPTR